MEDLADAESAEMTSENNTGSICSDGKGLESALTTVSLDFDKVINGVIQSGLFFIIHSSGTGATLDPTQKLHVFTRFEFILEHIFLDCVLIGRFV